MDTEPKMPIVNTLADSLEAEIGQLATQRENVKKLNEFRPADKKLEVNRKAAIDSCIRTGSVMKALFPDGIQLKNEEEFAVFRLFDRLVGDVANFARTGMKRSASLRDISLHAALLESVIASADRPGRETAEEGN
jgi:hypothetical protein